MGDLARWWVPEDFHKGREYLSEEKLMAAYIVNLEDRLRVAEAGRARAKERVDRLETWGR